MDWFRVYDQIIDDPKVLRLSEEFRWFYVAMMAISSRQTERGTLPILADIAIHLRVSEARTAKILDTLVKAGLIDVNHDDGGHSIHGWDKRQFKSDDVTARWRKHKDKLGANVGANVGANGSQTSQNRDRTETEQNTPLPPTGDEVVDFGRTTLGDRFDLEEIGLKLAGWRAAKIPDAWIMDAILVANCGAQPNHTASYMNTTLRRWKLRGGPDPEEVARAKPRVEPVPDLVSLNGMTEADLYGPKHQAKGRTA